MYLSPNKNTSKGRDTQKAHCEFQVIHKVINLHLEDGRRPKARLINSDKLI